MTHEHDPHDPHHHHHHDHGHGHHHHDHDHSHAHDLAPLTAHAPPQPDEKVHAYHQLLGLALKELLIEKGVFTADEIRKAIEYRDSITPAMGAAIVARAWTDPAYKKRLLENGTAAIKEFGTHIPDSVQVKVHDSTADMRYLVLPMRPEGTEMLTESELAELVTRDCMVGVTLPEQP